MFNATPDDLDMHIIYDVSHNIAKLEEQLKDLRASAGMTPGLLVDRHEVELAMT